MFQSIQVKKSPTADVRKSTQKDTDEVQVNVVLKSGHCINLPFGGFLHTLLSRLPIFSVRSAKTWTLQAHNQTHALILTPLHFTSKFSTYLHNFI